MADVHIIQLLCPQRHCIIAVCFEPARTTAERATRSLQGGVEDLVAQGILAPWCALCGAERDSWHTEEGATRFKTVNEAIPELKRLQAEQIAARQRLLRDPGRN